MTTEQEHLLSFDRIFQSPDATATDALAPLRANEIEAAADVFRADARLDGPHRFIAIDLSEPTRDEMLASDGPEVSRRARILAHLPDRHSVIVAIVSLTTREVVSWEAHEDVQPPLTADDGVRAAEIVSQDERWQDAMRRRGIEDFSLAHIDCWPSGYYGEAGESPRRRTGRALTWVRRRPGGHAYARPIEGLVVLIDLDAYTVLDVQDDGLVPLPEFDGEYSEAGISEPLNFPRFPQGARQDARPIVIEQPAGPSFRLSQNQLNWQKWVLRVGFTRREGLVLHTIGYRDKGRIRPVVYRAALSELFVPYGDPAPTHVHKNVFDVGEVGLGPCTNSLRLGCDCVGEIEYLDAVLADEDGKPTVIENAICLHEEDVGMAWKHTDSGTGSVEVRRMRRMVISSVVTVGNYEYAFYWYLYQDGTLEFEVKLSGVISTGALAPGATARHGGMVAPGLYGPNHQHFFNVRLDMMVDGLENSVEEVNSEPLPRGPANAQGNAWAARATELVGEADAAREASPATGRYWRIVNPAALNALDLPVSYRLEPGPWVPLLLDPEAYAARRARFTEKSLWITTHDPTQLSAAGEFVYQSRTDTGLPEYVKGSPRLTRQDLVVWHTFCAHHVVRPEDWPVMPVVTAGFSLRPDGFFDGNPALDIAASGHCAHHGDGHAA